MEEKYIYVVVKRSGNNDQYDGWNDEAVILYAFEYEHEARKYAMRKIVFDLASLCDSEQLDDFEIDSDDIGFEVSYGHNNEEWFSYNVEKIRLFEERN